jgi:hypothetical protein
MITLPSFRQAFGEISALAAEGGFYLACEYSRGGTGLQTSYFSSFPPDDPSIESAIVVVTGVHGIEGHPGHRLLCRLLRQEICRELPRGTGLVMAHLVNPFGFEHGRRVDENNVDVNRGCFDDTHPENLRYDGIKGLVEPDDLNPDALFALGELAKDRASFVAAVSGQWHSPRGIFFGGTETCQSGRDLKDVCGLHLFTLRKRIVAIDVHTGMGPYGVGTVLSPLASTDGLEADRARAIFGDKIQFVNAGKSIAVGVKGDFLPAMGRALPSGIEFTPVALEMGTTSVAESFPAIVAESWLHHHPERANEVPVDLIEDQLAMFRRTFAPTDDGEWMEKFYAAFGGLWQSAVKALS